MDFTIYKDGNSDIKNVIRQARKWCRENGIPVYNNSDFKQDGFTDNDDSFIAIVLTDLDNKQYGIFIDKDMIRASYLNWEASDGEFPRFESEFSGVRDEQMYNTVEKWMSSHTMYTPLRLGEVEDDD